MLLCALSCFSPGTRVADQPTNLRVTESSPAHLGVEWKDMAKDETGYRIWRRRLRPEGPKPWHVVGEVPAKATHFDDGGLKGKAAMLLTTAPFPDHIAG